MTTIAHGTVAPVLADGSSLLQQTVLTEEQTGFLSHDLSVLSKDRSARFAARMLNIGVRAVIVSLLIGLAVLVMTSSINLLLGGVVAVVLLFSPDALNVLDRNLAERREKSLRTLKFADTVFSMTRSHTFNSSLQQKTAMYFELIRTGEAKVGAAPSHRLRIGGGAGEPQVLRHVVVS